MLPNNIDIYFLL